MSSGETKFCPLQALNDIVVSRGPFSRIIQLIPISMAIFWKVIWATGDCGHADRFYRLFSFGGRPIVNPDLELLVVTPICPHSLSNRAVIATASETILMGVSSHKSPVVLTVDGQEGFSLKDKDQVVVSKGREKVRLVTFSGHSFYKILHQKLKD